MGNSQDTKLTNPWLLRKFSDRVDQLFNWKGERKCSLLRGSFHGSWHFIVGVWKKINKNEVGARKEFLRAKFQFTRWKTPHIID